MYFHLSTKFLRFIFKILYTAQANETLEHLGSIREKMVADKSNFEANMGELEDYLMFMGDQKKRVEQGIRNMTEERDRLLARNSQRDKDEFADLLEDISELDVDHSGISTSGLVIDTLVQPLLNRGIKIVGEDHV